MAKIAFFELAKFGLGGMQDYIRKFIKGQDILFFDEPLTEQNADKVADCDVIALFIYSKINDALLKKLGKAKLVTTMSTGFDHIDVEACRKRNIVACNVPAYGDNTVAEHAMALLLAISRKLIPSVERTRKGNFGLEGLRGFDLKGKTWAFWVLDELAGTLLIMLKHLECALLHSTNFPMRHWQRSAALLTFLLTNY